MSLLTAYKEQKLICLELSLLSLMIISLPSLEAPKNIFLVFFVGVAVLRQLKTMSLRAWGNWDWMFLAIVVSAFLSTVFAGLTPGDEWKGFRVLLTFIGVGWLLSRSASSDMELSWIFWMAILSAVPPLLFGLWELLVIHTKNSLELHSVGHVNHSAIYLTIIFGASFGASLSLWRSVKTSKKIILFALPTLFYMSLIVGQSRAAFGIGTLIGIILTILLVHNKKEMIALLFSFFVALVSMVFIHTPIVEKQIANQEANDVLSGRAVIWKTTIEAAKISPWLGIGIDNRGVLRKEDLKKSFEARHELFDESQYDFHFKHAHSFYLTNIAERGVVGAIVTLCFILMWLWYLIKYFYIARLSSEGAYLWAGSVSAWVATFGTGFVNTTFHHEHGILACLFLGLHLSFLNTHRAKLKGKP